jgi:Uma2 family endonuclease
MNTLPKPARMTADEFLVWAEMQPHRCELVNGEVVRVTPERVDHARVKLQTTIAFQTAIAARRHACETLIRGVAVRIDDATVYEPDVLVRCGDKLPGDATEVADPVILVEVVSPSAGSVDSGLKLADYFRLPSLRHYLVVDTASRGVIHYRVEGTDRAEARIIHSGPIALDPPGLEIEVGQIFATL